jgi:hypothetical protein
MKLCFIIFALIYPFINTYAIVDGYCIITSMDGSVKISSNNLDNNATTGATVKVGDSVIIDDKSKAELFTSNGIRLVALKKSSLTIKQIKQVDGSFIAPTPDNVSIKEQSQSIVDIDVNEGKVIGDVKKLQPMSIFTMKTPAGVVRIKGTVFSVEYKKSDDGNASFNVGCLVGRVEVQMADKNIPPIAIPAGKQMSVTSNPSMPPPPKGGGGESPKNNVAGKQMKIELNSIPPHEMKEMSIGAKIEFSRVVKSIAEQPENVGRKPDALDNVIKNIENVIDKQQVNPSPTGG